MSTIAIIGGGNLGTAIAEGIIKSKSFAPNNIVITKRNIQTIKYLEAEGLTITKDNCWAVKNYKYIILAVKPYQVKDVIAEFIEYIDPQIHIIISVITGVSLKDLQTIINKQCAIIKAMPNTAIAVSESMTCMSSINCTIEDQDFVQNLFNYVGKTIIIDDELMNAATVLGACGTAYAMRFIRANIQGGIEIGFNAQTAAQIAAQTIKGAATLLLEKNTHPEQEIDKVTTPKGCTIAGLNEMEHNGFSSSLIKGIATSYFKIKKDM